MFKHMNIATAIFATAVSLTAFSLSAHADSDDQMSGPSGSSSSSSIVVEETKGVQFKFKQRLSDLENSINNGEHKKWISVGQAAAFKTEHDRLVDYTNDVEKSGWPKDKVNQLEKDVTLFSSTVSTALSKGGPSAPAPNPEESGQPLPGK